MRLNQETGRTHAHIAHAADDCHCEDPKKHRRAKQEEITYAHSRRILCKKRGQVLGGPEGGYIKRPVSERRCCYETVHENQNVYDRQQNQGWTTELRNRFPHVIVYKINDLIMQ